MESDESGMPVYTEAEWKAHIQELLDMERRDAEALDELRKKYHEKYGEYDSSC
jgi:hypothetical protein